MEKNERKKPDKWESWKKTRAKGTLHFVVTKGLIMSFSATISFSILSLLYYDFDKKISEFPFYIFFGLIGGFIWGIIDWFFSETAYQRSRKNKDFDIWIPKQKN
jgi:hypothetical protein